ncbi:hypothetical protein HYALB_00000427 [Hymenoscyphus albidus]|uniref:Uncharacterized protein n=1 Tax=Hymenoscyphus albidus TaxID=595503 RepID=A0A9N9LIX3_9HELO|nr:hypothetical protein HYALB_00000427 [Hymenoscyphus albidus]
MTSSLKVTEGTPRAFVGFVLDQPSISKTGTSSCQNIGEVYSRFPDSLRVSISVGGIVECEYSVANVVIPDNADINFLGIVLQRRGVLSVLWVLAE